MLFHPQTTYGSDRFRQIFIDHWDRWLDLHEEDIPAAQRAYVRKTIQKMMGAATRNPATRATCVRDAATNASYRLVARPGFVLRPVPNELGRYAARSAPTSGSTLLRRNFSMSRTCISLSPPRPEPGRDWVAQELRQTFHDDRRLLDTMLKVAADAQPSARAWNQNTPARASA